MILYNNSSVTVTLPTPSLKYIQQFLNLRCLSDLLKTGYFYNAREITESMACFDAYFKYIREKFSGNIIVVGDGVYPRTGTLFAFRTTVNVISIDPLLRSSGVVEISKFPERLTLIKEKIENVSNVHNWEYLLNPNKQKTTLLVFCHSHAGLVNSIKTLKNLFKHFYIISIPCCVPDDLPLQPVISYDDFGIFSPNRRVNIYVL